ncbi:MAG: hypothetical protein AAB689_00530 [Patescibacteria group bacterium]
MNQDQPELTLEESVKQVMQTLPPLIRNYLAQGKYTAVAKGLMAKYGLRIDQGGVLEREIMLLLMGIENPDEFTQALAEEARLGQQVISGIVQDINAQIFIPLREEEMKSGEMKASPTPGLPKLIPVQKPSGTPPSHFHLQNKIAPPSRPAQPPAKPMDNRKLLEDHEEPHIEFKKTLPPNLPGAIYHPPIPKPIVPPIPPKPIPSPPAKPYSSDPYREPIDEK